MAKYGFGPAFSGEKILRHIHSTGAVEKLNIMSNVVSPYLDSLERRLDALKSIYTIVDNFTEIINSFFTHKHVTLDVGEGITIMSEANDTLNPFALSSGERHLLLIFCNTMIALDNPSIIIIDEPEISLNIKWQRALISSLWKIIETRPIQYIFATHSLELITQYRDRVLTLSHKEH
jgi:ABC-type glutathione transport system ATPase component